MRKLILKEICDLPNVTQLINYRSQDLYPGLPNAKASILSPEKPFTFPPVA
jgi:hypothetical protein